MVYKLYLKDEYGKKTLLAKSKSKELIEKAEREYDNKDEITFKYKLFTFIHASVVVVYCLQILIGTAPSIMFSFLVFILSVGLFALFLSREAPDATTYIVWED